MVNTCELLINIVTVENAKDADRLYQKVSNQVVVLKALPHTDDALPVKRRNLTHQLSYKWNMANLYDSRKEGTL